MLIFIILSSENWNTIMRIVVRSHGYFGVFFCSSAMMIGNFMLLNLFLAILLKYIDDQSGKHVAKLEEQKNESKIESPKKAQQVEEE